MSTLKARYTPGEEIANWLTHGLGLGLSIVGTLALVATSSDQPGRFWGTLIFGLSLILLYTSSTFYHATRDPDRKAILRMLDHAAIFLLIAGTYTPFMLVNLRGPWGYGLLALIWSLALLGVVVELTPLRRRRGLGIGLCLLMGWLVVVATRPMLQQVAEPGLWLLLAGGLAYTGGVGFYLWRSLPYHHAVWHVFVLAGSVLHYLSVYHFAIP